MTDAPAQRTHEEISAERNKTEEKTTRRPLFDARILGAVGVLSAGLLLSEVNVLASRTYRRIDVSETQAYSLSEVSRKLVSELDSPIHITVLLPAGDARLTEARHLLESYRAHTSEIDLRFLDPDRDTAEFLALGQKLSLGEEELNQSGLIGASFLIERGTRRWFVPSSQLRSVDGEGHEHSRMEAALSEGIGRVLENEETHICFVSGHGERSIDDAAPEGLLELSRQLRKNNLHVERVPLDVPDLTQALAGCQAIAVVGPSRSFSRPQEDALLSAWNKGTSMLLFLDPMVDGDAKIVSSGLSRLTAELGVIEGSAFILERDPQSRLPEGLGETFFAQPKTHPITRNLSTSEARLDARLLIIAAQPLRQAAGVPAIPFVETTKQAVAIFDLNSLAQGSSNQPGSLAAASQQTGKDKANFEAPLSLAWALDEASATPHRRGLVVGTSNPLWNSSFRDAILHGNRLFAESCFAWTLARRGLVSVPERPQMTAGLQLSEDSLSALLRYVLLYMPLTAAGAGAFVLVRRRQREERSRQKVEPTP